MIEDGEQDEFLNMTKDLRRILFFLFLIMSDRLFINAGPYFLDIIDQGRKISHLDPKLLINRLSQGSRVPIPVPLF